MQRSKQQALMFLLGAVLVGGVLGVSGARMFDHRERSWARRQRMYTDLALTQVQQQALDSLLDEQNCQLRAVMKPVRPQLDSIRSAGRRQMDAILNAEQLATLEIRRQEMARRDSMESARRDSIAATRKSTVTCRN